MKTARAVLEKLQKKRGRAFHTMAVSVGTSLVLLIIGPGVLLMRQKPDFFTALTQVTQLYYAEDFSEKIIKERAETCRKVETGLQKLLTKYAEKPKQRRLLLLLAANGEMAGEAEHAAVYYEQLLLYDPGYRETYGQYGLFLLRAGQQSASRELWEAYQKLDDQGSLEEMESREVSLWEEKLREEMPETDVDVWEAEGTDDEKE